MMQRRTQIFIAVGAAGVLGFLAIAGSAFAHRDRGHGWTRGGYHHGMKADRFRSLAERYDLNQDGKITRDEIDRNRAQWHSEFGGNDGMALEEFQNLWLKARRYRMVRAPRAAKPIDAEYAAAASVHGAPAALQRQSSR